MIVQIVLLLAGLALVVFGADSLVDGSSSVARRFKVSEFVIGLTIVGMGTSAPEMVVSWLGAIEGNSAVAAGNIIGSNIFNTLLILGLTAIILPIGITRSNKRTDIPMNIAVTLLMLILGMDATLFGCKGGNVLSRLDGGIMLAIFIVYMWLSFRAGKDSGQEENQEKQKALWLSIILILGGLAALIFGGRLFVNNATAIAKELGVSDKFIAITLLAGGTSMPELATCVVAAIKKKGALALGNIIGSNLFNILLILGGSALINPVSFDGFTLVDLGVLLFSAVALCLSIFIGKRDKVDALDGSIFVAAWAGYMAYLIINL